MDTTTILDSTFQLNRLLGEGASGKVYEVTLLRPWQGLSEGTRLALKHYKSEILQREGSEIAIKRRMREAVLQHHLKHSNVIKIYDTREFWSDQDAPYLVMELLDGETLEELVNRVGLLPSEQVIDISRQLVAGLTALHSSGILHRDIKPQNIQYTASGRVVILDLGVCRPLQEETLTTSQSFLGTLRYAAPEWLFAEQCTIKSDIYSLGTVLYLLLTGKDVFSDIKLYSRLVIAIKEMDIEIELQHAQPEIAFLCDIVNDMLHKRPEARLDLSFISDYLENLNKGDAWSTIVDRRANRLIGIAKTSASWSKLLELFPEETIIKCLALENPAPLYASPEVVLLGRIPKESYMEAYKSLPVQERIEWVHKVLRHSVHSELGIDIEFRWNVANLIDNIEKDTDVLKEIKPDLELANSDFSDMMRGLAQENP